MILFANQLYCSLQKELAHYQTQSFLSLKEIEFCFQSGYRHWAILYRKFAFYHFSGVQEEIHFFKSTKPRFTSYIEYTQLLYQAQLFLPDRREERLKFWQKEAERLSRFIKDYPSFYQYYISGDVCRDQIYFVRSSANQTNTFAKPYEDEHLASLYDPLIARVLCLRQYACYVNNRLQQRL